MVVKQHTPQQNKIIGYTYNLTLTAPPEVQQLAYYAGLGEDNSMGFGFLEELKS
ncbi:CRISPR-associated endoribonuclease Cas6 [Tunicatimonas pelagia]|uniref:CRISPR-associated endoribonuclease Cas6 n=1 Tax=Tunicatimonas pelagia TaxID=931531 RepID=UPI00345C74E0